MAVSWKRRSLLTPLAQIALFPKIYFILTSSSSE